MHTNKTYSMTLRWRRTRAHSVVLHEYWALNGWLDHMLAIPNWDLFRTLQMRAVMRNTLTGD
jgi:hypothetical protein